MKMRSSDAACHASFNSPNLIFNSSPNSDLVCSAERRRISETPRKCGFSSQITHEFGEIDTSQSVKAYRASMVLSDDSSGAT